MEYEDLFKRLKMEIYCVPTSGITRLTPGTQRNPYCNTYAVREETKHQIEEIVKKGS
jgi:hypothetical protein